MSYSLDYIGFPTLLHNELTEFWNVRRSSRSHWGGHIISRLSVTNIFINCGTNCGNHYILKQKATATTIENMSYVFSFTCCEWTRETFFVLTKWNDVELKNSRKWYPCNIDYIDETILVSACHLWSVKKCGTMQWKVLLIFRRW